MSIQVWRRKRHPLIIKWKKRFGSAISRGACTFKPSLPFYFKKEMSNQGILHKIMVSSIP